MAALYYIIYLFRLIKNLILILIFIATWNIMILQNSVFNILKEIIRGHYSITRGGGGYIETHLVPGRPICWWQIPRYIEMKWCSLAEKTLLANCDVKKRYEMNWIIYIIKKRHHWMVAPLVVLSRKLTQAIIPPVVVFWDDLEGYELISCYMKVVRK